MAAPKPNFVVDQGINVGDVMEVSIEGMNEGTPWALVRHYRVLAAADDEAIPEQIASKWESDILPLMQAELTDQWQAECAYVSRAAPAGRKVEFFSWTPLAGSVATDGVPNGTALVLRFDTTRIGGRGRGRAYICGLPEASTNAGRLTAAKEAAWVDIAAEMGVTITGGGNTMIPVVFSRTDFLALPDPFTMGQWEDAVFCSSAIDDTSVVPNLASQRDRRYPRPTFG